MNIQPLEIDGELFNNPYLFYHMQEIADSVGTKAQILIRNLLNDYLYKSLISKSSGESQVIITLTGITFSDSHEEINV